MLSYFLSVFWGIIDPLSLFFKFLFERLFFSKDSFSYASLDDVLLNFDKDKFLPLAYFLNTSNKISNNFE